MNKHLDPKELVERANEYMEWPQSHHAANSLIRELLDALRAPEPSEMLGEAYDIIFGLSGPYQGEYSKDLDTLSREGEVWLKKYAQFVTRPRVGKKRLLQQAVETFITERTLREKSITHSIERAIETYNSGGQR